jgi:hypothetical protein
LGEGESGDSMAVRTHAALARAKRAGRNSIELAMSRHVRVQRAPSRCAPLAKQTSHAT